MMGLRSERGSLFKGRSLTLELEIPNNFACACRRGRQVLGVDMRRSIATRRRGPK